ncbi:uncharacterized protein Z520_05637 [Fonsecaea multimorphosa CBS 102226]|uniref:DNL-type domain-containing protein n=1 Tax=Fonsecaea multimorphosa CBS 102226 TaxID=1442371 RepID=A0A0D2IMT1_9EURO|nr:uncharacterized protein Z520_05637 [Fonsecaea multimorphosa CBS 102226]KIX98336.1 hypothetical protein Z520_05637 [Fonsecaea multimorphosa CBS 102226]OAL24531.1 hypothetical protein AYO22_05320 [Fonsecaea multimorphosa]
MVAILGGDPLDPSSSADCLKLFLSADSKFTFSQEICGTMRSMSQVARRAAGSTFVSRSIRNYSRASSLAPTNPLVWRQPTSTRRPFAPINRYNSSLSVPGAKPQPAEERDEPSYELSFTCKPCLYRSTHRITKQGYHRGTVLVTCPSCKARHVIADHLKVFLDKSSTLEDILRKKAAAGEDFTKLLKKGRLGIRPGEMVGNEGEEDLEFWEDGTESVHTPIEGKQASQQG